MRLALLATLAALTSTVTASTAWAGDRYAVVIGNNLGARDEGRLRYAEADALKVYETLRDVGGFSPVDMTLLVGEDVDAVRAGIAAMNARVRSAEGAVFVVYYSGHADADALHLGAQRLPNSEVNDLVAGSAARFRVLVVDACRSGALARRKGGTADLPIAIAASAPVDAEGFVVLTASAAGEDAQESELLRGSFFTHHWVSGLRGAADVDNDGTVSLEESYRHAFTHTVRQSSATLAGTQHPTYRYDVTGAGSVVLATPGRATRGARLTFPPGYAFLLFDDGAAGRVVAELPKEATARTLRVEAGRYFVRGRGDDAVYEGDVDVDAGGSVVVDVDALARIDYARLVRKGSGERSLGHETHAGLGLRTSIVNAKEALVGTCFGGRVGHSFALRYLNVDVNAGGCRMGLSNAFVDAVHVEGNADVGLSAVVDLPVVSVGVGGFVGGAIIHQSFVTTGVAPDRLTAAATLGLRGSARLPFGNGFVLGVDVDGATYVFRGGADDAVTTETPLVLRTTLLAGWEF